MTKHGDSLHLAVILTIFFLGLATFLWIAAIQAERPDYRNGADPDSGRQTADYRNGSDPGSVPPTPGYRDGSDPGAGGCIAYRDGSDPDTVRYTKGC